MIFVVIVLIAHAITRLKAHQRTVHVEMQFSLNFFERVRRAEGKLSSGGDGDKGRHLDEIGGFVKPGRSSCNSSQNRQNDQGARYTQVMTKPRPPS
jgi:hypothetical protein